MLAPYTGTSLAASGTPLEGVLTLAGVNGIGVESHVDQEITLFNKMAIGANQEWRLDSLAGSLRQLSNRSDRSLNLNSFMLTLNAVNAGNTFNLGNPISGTGGLTITGAGTATLTAANTYSGGTILNGGVLSVSSDGNLGAASGALTFNGGVLQVTGTAFTSTTRTITWGANGGGFDIADPANVFTMSQMLTGGGSLAKLGNGTLTLTAANTYSSDTIINAGTLALTGTGSIAASSDVRDDGVFDISGTAAGASIKTLSGGGIVNLGTQILTLTAAADTFRGVIQGTGG